jgi:hypothetical protein
MGGIGVSGNGTAFLVFSYSSITYNISTMAAAGPMGTIDWSDPVLLETGDGTYSGTPPPDGPRWGDYVGIAADPMGSAAVWQSDEVPTSDGKWRTSVSRLVVDALPPTPPGAPNQALVAGSQLTDTVPVRISWAAATDPGSGVAEYDIDVNQFGTGFSRGWTSGTNWVINREWYKPYSATAINRSYRYRVDARDAVGNTSAQVTSSGLTANIYQQNNGVSYTGTWRIASSTLYSATFTFAGRSVAFLTYRGPARGRVKIYVDGRYKGTFTLTSSVTKARNLFYAIGFPTSGSHKLKLVVASGRVDVDGFVVLK